jgi:hypothetical protein
LLALWPGTSTPVLGVKAFGAICHAATAWGSARLQQQFSPASQRAPLHARCGSDLRVRSDVGLCSLLESCLAAMPDSPLCAAPLGGLLLVIDPPRGEALLLRILPHDPTGTAHLRLAQHWSRHGQGDRALVLYERFLRGSTVKREQIAALVELAIAAGRFPQARGYLRELVVASSLQQPAPPPPSAAVVSGCRARG